MRAGPELGSSAPSQTQGAGPEAAFGRKDVWLQLALVWGLGSYSMPLSPPGHRELLDHCYILYSVYSIHTVFCMLPEYRGEWLANGGFSPVLLCPMGPSLEWGAAEASKPSRRHDLLLQVTTTTSTASSTSGTRGRSSLRPTRPLLRRVPMTGSSSPWGPTPSWPWPTPSTAPPRGCTPTSTCGCSVPSASSSPSW